MIKRYKREREAMKRWAPLTNRGCDSARKWFDKQRSPYQAYQRCKRGDWIWWLLNKIRVASLWHRDGFDKKLIKIMENGCTRANKSLLVEANYYRKQFSYYKILSLLKRYNLIK